MGLVRAPPSGNRWNKPLSPTTNKRLDLGLDAIQFVDFEDQMFCELNAQINDWCCVAYRYVTNHLKIYDILKINFLKLIIKVVILKKNLLLQNAKYLIC